MDYRGFVDLAPTSHARLTSLRARWHGGVDTGGLTDAGEQTRIGVTILCTVDAVRPLGCRER